MSEKDMALKELKEKINNNFKPTLKNEEIIEKICNYNLNYSRINAITNLIIDTRLDKSSLMAFLCYQLYKEYPNEGESIEKQLTSEEQSMVEDYKTIQDINQLTLSEEIEDIRRMFLVMSNDMRVVIIKLGGIYYDISILKLL